MARILLLLAAAAILTNCENATPESESKFDQATLEKLRSGLNLSSEELTDLCSKNSLIVYVGNGEAVGKLSFFEHFPVSEQAGIRSTFDQTNAKFSNYVTNTVPSELERSLMSNRGLCHDNAKDGSTLTLAAIVDGNGQNDSKISTTTFTYDAKSKNWSILNNGKKYWSLNGENFSEVSAGARFELNMPKQLPLVIGYIVTKSKVNNDQITYIFKTHGGLLSKDINTRPDLFVKGQDKENAAHVFLFDTNGPNNQDLSQDSGMFYYLWSKQNACRIAQAKGAEFVQQLKCTDEDINEGKRKFTANVGIRDKNTANVGINDNNTAGIGKGDTANVGINDSNTAGIGKGDTANVGINDNNTAGIGKGDTANVGINDNNTAGIGKGDTANVGLGSNTAGPGKGALSTINLLNTVNSIDDERFRPDAYMNIGQAASYDFNSFNSNLKDKVKVHLLAITPGADEALPTIVYLDSCYGSSLVLNSFKYSFSYLMKSAQYYGNKYIPSYIDQPKGFYGFAFSNPNPFYIKGLDYLNAPIDLFKVWPAALIWDQQPELYKSFKTKHPDSKDNYQSIKSTVDMIKNHWRDNLSLYKVADDGAANSTKNNAQTTTNTNAVVNPEVVAKISDYRPEFNQMFGNVQGFYTNSR